MQLRAPRHRADRLAVHVEQAETDLRNTGRVSDASTANAITAAESSC